MKKLMLTLVIALFASNFVTAQSNELRKGEKLEGKKILMSANGLYMLRMQADDGHLCVYKVKNTRDQGEFVWGNGVHGFNGSKLVMQEDGNLVVYDNENTAKWNSGTHPYHNSKFQDSSLKPVKLVLTNEGKLKMYNASNVEVWSN